MGFRDSALYQDMTPMLLGVAFFSSLGAFSYGYVAIWYASIIGTAHFNRMFGSGIAIENGVVVRKLSSSDISSSTALGTAGIMIGCMIAPFINEIFGRRISFVAVGIIGIMGTVIQALSTLHHSFWTLVGGKIIINTSAGMASAVVGLYQAECSPPRVRGALINFYTLMTNIGSVIGYAIVYIVHKRTDSLVWMLPIGLQFILLVVVAIGSIFLPESPRWLVSRDRYDDAISTLRKLRGRNVPEIDIRNEVYEIRAAYEEERRLARGISIMQLFHGSDCRRTLIAVGVQCLQQAQGVAFMTSYMYITLLALGFTNIYDVLIKVLSVNMIFVFLGFYLPDRFGRRPLLLIGTALMALSMFTVSMISSFTDNKPTGVLGRLTLAAVIIWIVVFTLTWGPLPWIICSEVPSNYLREKTLAIASWSGFGVALISNLLTPYIQDAQYGDLQGRIGFVWCGFGVISFFFCYFLVPELRNRPLEELDILFNEGVPARKFSTYRVSLNPVEKSAMTPALAYREEKA